MICVYFNATTLTISLTLYEQRLGTHGKVSNNKPVMAS